MTSSDAAFAALTDGLSSFLGPPSGDIQYLRWWSRGQFEVAIEPRAGINVWISALWRPTGGEFAGLACATKDAKAPRLHSLRGNCPTLWEGNAVRVLSGCGDKVGAVVRCVRACAVKAGAIPGDGAIDHTT